MNRKISVDDLTLREKIGQTAMAYPTNDMSELSKNPYGGQWATGAIQFKTVNMNDEKNNNKVTAETTKEKLRGFNSELKVPLLPAMDSTAGIKRPFYEMGFVADAVAVGATDNEEIAYRAGVARAKQLKAVGTGWLWWPEIDLANRDSTIMWGRLFSDDPERASKLACAAIKGCQDTGVAATIKHFPGSDSIEYRDPHGTPVVLNISMEDWEKKQGKMFQEAIDSGVYAVMTAHNSFPACDDTVINGYYVPSSMSYKVITELLKGKMGFEGVVITDGIGMKGLLDIYESDLAEIYIEALNAGNDVILGVKDDYIDIIEKAVSEGRVSIERIDDACRRVLNMKEKLGMLDENFNGFDNDMEETHNYVSSFNKEVAENSLSLVVNKKNLIPLSKDRIKNVTVVILSTDESHIESLSVMKEEFGKRGASVSFERNILSYEDSARISEESDLIIYVSYLMRGVNDSFYGDEKKSFSYVLRDGIDKSIGIGMGAPFAYFDYFFGFHTFINTYNYYKETQEALVSALYGEIPFKGGEPFRLIPDEFIYLK